MNVITLRKIRNPAEARVRGRYGLLTPVQDDVGLVGIPPARNPRASSESLKHTRWKAVPEKLFRVFEAILLDSLPALPEMTILEGKRSADQAKQHEELFRSLESPTTPIRPSGHQRHTRQRSRAHLLEAIHVSLPGAL